MLEVLPDSEHSTSPLAIRVPAQAAAAEEAPSFHSMAPVSDASSGVELPTSISPLPPHPSPLVSVAGKVTATVLGELAQHAMQKQEHLPAVDAVMQDNIRLSIFRGDECIACICLLCKMPMSRNYLKPHFRSKQCRKAAAAALAENDIDALSDQAQTNPVEGIHFIVDVPNPLVPPHKRVHLDSQARINIEHSMFRSKRMIVSLCLLCKRPFSTVRVVKDHIVRFHLPKLGMSAASKASLRLGTHYLTNLLNPLCFSPSAPSSAPSKVSAPAPAETAEATSASREAAASASISASPASATASPAPVLDAEEAPSASPAVFRREEENVQLDREMIAQIRMSRLAGDDVIPCICLLCKKPMLERYIKHHLHHIHFNGRTSLSDALKVLPVEGELALYGVVNPLLTEKDRSHLDLETVRKIKLSRCRSSRFIRTICLLCNKPYQGVFFNIANHVRTVHWKEQDRSKKRPVVCGVHYLRNVLNPLLRSTPSSSSTACPVLSSCPSTISGSETEAVLMSAATSKVPGVFNELDSLAHISAANRRQTTSPSQTEFPDQTCSRVVEAPTENMEQLLLPSSPGPSSTGTVAAAVSVPESMPESSELVPACLASVDADIRSNIAASEFARHECLRFLCLACKRPFASRTFGLHHVGDAHANLLCKRRRLDTSHSAPSEPAAPEQGKHYLLDFINPLLPIEQRFAFDQQTTANIAASRFARQRSILGLCLLCKQPISDELSLMDHLRVVHEQTSPTRGTHYLSNVLNPLQFSCSAGPAVRPEPPEKKQKQATNDLGSLADSDGESTQTNAVELDWKERLKNRRIIESDFASVEVIEFWCELCSKPLLLSASQQHMALLHPEMLRYPVQEGVHYRTLLPNPLVPASRRPRLPPAAVLAISNSSSSQSTRIGAVCLLCPAVLNDTEAVLTHFQQTHASLPTPPLPNQHYVSNILNPLLFERCGPPIEPAEQVLDRVEELSPAAASPPLQSSSAVTAELPPASARPCPSVTTVDDSQPTAAAASRTASVTAVPTQVMPMAPGARQTTVPPGPSNGIHAQLLLEIAQDNREHEMTTVEAPNLVSRAGELEPKELALERRDTKGDKRERSSSTSSSNSALSVAVFESGSQEASAAAAAAAFANPRLLMNLRESKYARDECIRFVCLQCQVPLRDRLKGQRHLLQQHHSKRLKLRRQPGGFQTVLPVENQHFLVDVTNPLLAFADFGRHLPEEARDAIAANETYAERRCLPALCLLCHCPLGSQPVMMRHIERHHGVPLHDIARGVHYELNLMNPLMLRRNSVSESANANAGSRSYSAQGIENIRSSMFAGDECLELYCLLCEKPMKAKSGRLEKHMLNRHHLSAIEGETFVQNVPNPLLSVEQRPALAQAAIDNIAASEYANNVRIPGFCLLCNMPYKIPAKHVSCSHFATQGKRKPFPEPRIGEHFLRNLLNPLLFSRSSTLSVAAFHPQAPLEDASAGVTAAAATASVAVPAADAAPTPSSSSRPVDKSIKPSLGYLALRHLKESEMAGDQCIRCICLVCETPLLFVGEPLLHIQQHLRLEHRLEAIENENYMLDVVNPLVPPSKRALLSQPLLDAIAASSWATATCIPGICLICEAVCVDAVDHVRVQHASSAPKNGVDFLRHVLNPLRDCERGDSQPSAPPLSPAAAGAASPLWSRTALATLRSSEYSMDECLPFLCLLCESFYPDFSRGMTHIRKKHRIDVPVEHEHYRAALTNPLVSASDRVSLDQETLDNIAESGHARDKCLRGVCLHCKMPLKSVVRHVRVIHKGADRSHRNRPLPHGLEPVRGVDFHLNLLNPLVGDVAPQQPQQPALLDDRARAEEAEALEPQSEQEQEYEEQLDAEVVENLAASSYAGRECIRCLCLLCKQPFGGTVSGLLAHVRSIHRRDPVLNVTHLLDVVNPLVGWEQRLFLDDECRANVASSVFGEKECIPVLCLVCKTPLSGSSRMRSHFEAKHADAEPAVDMSDVFLRDVLNPLLYKRADTDVVNVDDATSGHDAELVRQIRISSFVDDECIRLVCLLCSKPFATLVSGINHISSSHLDEASESGQDGGESWRVPVEGEHYRCEVVNPLVPSCRRPSLDQLTLRRIEQSKYAERVGIFGLCLLCRQPFGSEWQVKNHVRLLHEREPERGRDFLTNLVNPLLFERTAPALQPLEEDIDYHEDELQDEGKGEGDEVLALLRRQIRISPYSRDDCVRYWCLLCNKPFSDLRHVHTHRQGPIHEFEEYLEAVPNPLLSASKRVRLSADELRCLSESRYAQHKMVRAWCRLCKRAYYDESMLRQHLLSRSHALSKPVRGRHYHLNFPNPLLPTISLTQLRRCIRVPAPVHVPASRSLPVRSKCKKSKRSLPRKQQQKIVQAVQKEQELEEEEEDLLALQAQCPFGDTRGTAFEVDEVVKYVCIPCGLPLQIGMFKSHFNNFHFGQKHGDAWLEQPIEGTHFLQDVRNPWVKRRPRSLYTSAMLDAISNSSLARCKGLYGFCLLCYQPFSRISNTLKHVRQHHPARIRHGKVLVGTHYLSNLYNPLLGPVTPSPASVAPRSGVNRAQTLADAPSPEPAAAVSTVEDNASDSDSELWAWLD